jgi:threonine aldolase
VESNAVFATLPANAIEPLLERFQFYVWDERSAEVRWMCSWDTSEDDVVALAQSVTELSRRDG